MNLFTREPRDRYWLQMDNTSFKRWLLICSKDEHRDRKQSRNYVSTSLDAGRCKHRAALAELVWDYSAQYWWIDLAKDVDLLESLKRTAHSAEFVHAIEAFEPVNAKSSEIVRAQKLIEYFGVRR
jgi:hypothetical protein